MDNVIPLAEARQSRRKAEREQAKVKRVKFEARNVKVLGDGRWHDDAQPGLYLHVRNDGASRVWMQRYRDLMGRDAWLSLGPVAKWDLSDVRKRVKLNVALLLEGKEPVKLGITFTSKGGQTFAEDWEAYVEHNVGGGANATWDAWSAKHASDVRQSFVNHLVALGGADTSKLTGQLLAKAIEPVWMKNNATGKLLITRSRAVIALAMRRRPEVFKGLGNPADSILAFMPKGYAQKKAHRKAVNWREMPGFYSVLCEAVTKGRDPLRFLILTCAPRAGEVWQMRCGEIDFDAATWTVPDEHMKGRTTRIIPLSQAALAVLGANWPANPHPDAFVWTGRGGMAKEFYGDRQAKPCKRVAAESESGGGRGSHQNMRNTLHAVCKMLGIDADNHGFRTSFSDYVLANRKSLNDVDAKDIALDHVIADAVKESYRDETLLEHRRILAERWAAYLLGVEYTGPYEVEAQ